MEDSADNPNVNHNVLIEEVRKYPILYNMKHPEFLKKKKKDGIWETIAQTVNMNNFSSPDIDGPIAKKRWTNIRDRYKKVKKQPRSGSSLDEKPTYEYYEFLTFLDNFEEDRQTNYKMYFHLFPQLRKNEEKFAEYTRMKISSFDKLLRKISPVLESKIDSSIGIKPEQMLVVTLRFLATGISFRSLQFSFRMGISTVANVVRLTCSAIISVLQDNVCFPSSPEEWMEISEEFERRWSFPNVLGCVDGKHIKLKKPPNSGTQFFNYKGTFSTVLMAICDAKYRFIYFDVGNYGHNHDSHVLKNCSFGKGLANNQFDFPEDRSITTSRVPIPYFFLGDGGFPLSERMMKPFAGSNTTIEQTNFNYRLSHARRVIENCFGILSKR